MQTAFTEDDHQDVKGDIITNAHRTMANGVIIVPSKEFAHY
jgi:hypothetical protein